MRARERISERRLRAGGLTPDEPASRRFSYGILVRAWPPAEKRVAPFAAAAAAAGGVARPHILWFALHCTCFSQPYFFHTLFRWLSRTSTATLRSCRLMSRRTWRARATFTPSASLRFVSRGVGDSVEVPLWWTHLPSLRPFAVWTPGRAGGISLRRAQHGAQAARDSGLVIRAASVPLWTIPALGFTRLRQDCGAADF